MSKRLFMLLIIAYAMIPSGIYPQGLYSPFLPNESWWVSQSPGQTGHVGSLANAWDFNWSSPGSADLDKPVLASGDGVAVFAGLSGSLTSGWGYTVVIQLDAGGYTRVAHLDEVCVKVGEYVQRGQVVGLNGSTGQSTGPHIHYQYQDTKNGSSTPSSFADIGNPTGCDCGSEPGGGAYH